VYKTNILSDFFVAVTSLSRLLMEFLFWFSVFMIVYAYFGYLLCLFVISLFKKSKNRENEFFKNYNPDFPAVTLIITAYNEEERIKEKIDGSLLQDYPKDKYEIIVASDCSSDNTDEIVKSYKGEVKLVRAPERKGKENAQKYAVETAAGEIFVFSDVATILEPTAISSIVRNFSDPSIGCVSSEDRFIDPDGSISGEGTYVKYEMLLRKLESRVNTLVGLSGSFFAARREVCKNWSTELQSDFNTLLNSVRRGLRGFSDPKSIGFYKNLADEKKEYNRKVRTILRGISVMMRNLSLLNPFKYGLFGWQLFSHKICRWLVPFFLIFLFISNLFIIYDSFFYLLTFGLQVIFYLMTYIYYQEVKEGKNRVLKKIMRIPYFFVTVNLSILDAWWRYVRGERATFWEPSKR